MATTIETKKRVKEVFANAGEVAHKWASQSQDEGRNSTKNIYFRGRTIYSYGSHFPMASFVEPKLAKRLGKNPGVVLKTSRSYSNTTAKHLNYVSRAINHCITIYADNPVPTSNTDHEDNIARMIRGIQALAEQQAKAVKASYTGSINSAIDNLDKYVTLFALRKNKQLRTMLGYYNDPLAWAKIAGVDLVKAEAKNAKRLANIAAEESAKEFARVKRLEQIKHLTPLAVKHWRQGGGINDRLPVPDVSEQWFYVSSVIYELPTMLRLKGNEIETSRQARISVETAKRIWPSLQAKQNPGDVEGYRGVGFNHAVEFVIGCHRIPYCELELMAIELGLVETPCKECKGYSIS